MARASAGAVIPLVILAIWYWVTQRQFVKPIFLPSPIAVATAFQKMVVSEGFVRDLLTSLSVVVRGCFWGILLGLTVGIGAGGSLWVERMINPLLNALRQVPALAWFPLIALWIGIGDLAKEVVIAKSVFFPVFLNTLQGIRNVPQQYVEMAQVFGFTRGQMLRRVIFPGAAPTILVGIRFGAGLAWAMIVAAEMLSGRSGLGFLLEQSQDMLLTDHLFVVIVTIGVVGFVVDLVLRYIEHRLFRWKEDIARG
jgi:sulfonate transport system permease protein